MSSPDTRCLHGRVHCPVPEAGPFCFKSNTAPVQGLWVLFLSQLPLKANCGVSFIQRIHVTLLGCHTSPQQLLRDCDHWFSSFIIVEGCFSSVRLLISWLIRVGNPFQLGVKKRPILSGLAWWGKKEGKHFTLCGCCLDKWNNSQI